jgi:hypothetical protein
MNVTSRATRWAGARLGARLSRSVPWIGAAVALATIAATVRRKGWLGGAADTALNATPFLGALKNTAEVVRGRDFIRDRRSDGSI